MAAKLGRNDPCWCGSQQKYKKCHLNRQHESPVQHWEASEKFRKAFSSKYCSAPAAMQSACSGQIIRAHTVPRASSLAKIAENGHVYAFVPSLNNLIKNKGVLHPELVGINKASTFTGFCSHHDAKLFSPVELHEFSGSQEQCHLLGYRAYAREIFTKTSAAKSSKNHSQMDRGHPLLGQLAIQTQVAAYDHGIQLALKDIAYNRPRFEAPLVTGDYSNVRAYVLSFDEAPPVMCSGAFAPEQDFDGLELQDLADEAVAPKMMSVSSFFGGRYGHVVLTWLPGDDLVCVPLVRSLSKVPDSDLASALVRFMFEYFENVHIAPAFWRSLALGHQEALITRMAASASPVAPRSSHCLKPDGWQVAHWKVTERRLVGIAI